MLYVKSIVKVTDNSGGRYGKCIRILRRKPKACAQIGDIIIMSIKRAAPNKKNKKRFNSKRSCCSFSSKYSSF